MSNLLLKITAREMEKAAGMSSLAWVAEAIHQLLGGYFEDML